MNTQTYTGTLVVLDCFFCGMTFGLDRSFDQQRRNDHKTFWCPAGHGQVYSGQSEAEKLRAELERQKRRVGWLTSSRDQARAEAEHQAAKARGYKGALVKTKRRIAKGVCPNCNRHFANVERHMASMHPEDGAP